MEHILEMLKDKKDIVALKGATKEEIERAEAALNLQFSSDYEEYLERYGVVSIGGHEIIGIVDSARLNVVHVTLNERKRNKKASDDMYVVEKLNIDDIVIWQDTQGMIYETRDGSSIKKIYNSLEDYILSFEEFE